MRERIGVIFGGRSVEHEISIISALQVMKALKKAGYTVIPFYINLDGSWLTGERLLTLEHFKPLTQVNGDEVVVDLAKGKFYRKRWYGKSLIEVDLLFPMIHGTGGEDGTLQGFLELINVPYVGSGVAASAIGMDKVLTKMVLQQKGIPTLDYFWFMQSCWYHEKEQLLAKINQRFAFPLIVKPAILGSSIGISVVNNNDELEDAIDLAVSLSDKVLIEPQVRNLREFNCSVLGEGKELLVSECEEPLKTETILSYADKYLKTGGKKLTGKINQNGLEQGRRNLPVQIDPELKNQIQRYAKEAFYEIAGSGVARIDFIWDEDRKQLYLGEFNTIPGSLAFYLWEASGVSFEALLKRLLELAKQRFVRKNSLVTHYSNNLFS